MNYSCKSLIALLTATRRHDGILILYQGSIMIRHDNKMKLNMCKSVLYLVNM